MDVEGLISIFSASEISVNNWKQKNTDRAKVVRKVSNYLSHFFYCASMIVSFESLQAVWF